MSTVIQKKLAEFYQKENGTLEKLAMFKINRIESYWGKTRMNMYESEYDN